MASEKSHEQAISLSPPFHHFPRHLLQKQLQKQQTIQNTFVCRRILSNFYIFRNRMKIRKKRREMKKQRKREGGKKKRRKKKLTALICGIQHTA